MERRVIHKLYDLYVKHAEIIGAFYVIIPVIGWLVISIFTVPFREVYILRVLISILFGAPLAGYINRYGLTLWMIKHGSPKGPANSIDGLLIGSSLGIGMSILPTLTTFIASNHIELAKTYFICSILAAGLLGAIIGSSLGAIGKTYANYNDYKRYLKGHY